MELPFHICQTLHFHQEFCHPCYSWTYFYIISIVYDSLAKQAKLVIYYRMCDVVETVLIDQSDLISTDV
jgi:hypothetical protein